MNTLFFLLLYSYNSSHFRKDGNKKKVRVHKTTRNSTSVEGGLEKDRREGERQKKKDVGRRTDATRDAHRPAISWEESLPPPPSSLFPKATRRNWFPLLAGNAGQWYVVVARRLECRSAKLRQRFWEREPGGEERAFAFTARDARSQVSLPRYRTYSQIYLGITHGLDSLRHRRGFSSSIFHPPFGGLSTFRSYESPGRNWYQEVPMLQEIFLRNLMVLYPGLPREMNNAKRNSSSYFSPFLLFQR